MLIFIFSSRIINVRQFFKKMKKRLFIGDPHQTIPHLHLHLPQHHFFKWNYLQICEQKEWELKHNWVLNAKWILWEHSTFSASSIYVKFYTHLMCAHKQYRHFCVKRQDDFVLFQQGGPLQTTPPPLAILL